MKKRFLLTILATFLITGINVYAAKYEVDFKTVPEKVIVAEHSENFVTDMRVIKTEENQDRIEFETEVEKFITYLVYNDKIEAVIPQKITAKEENSKDYPAVYEKEKYANRAIMLVTSVSSVYENNEPYIKVDVLFHGKEKTLKIAEDVLIAKTPEAYSGIKGQTVSHLKKGDIINISLLFNKVVDEVYLIFRPTSKNPILQNTAFESLFSDNGIVIGKSDYKAMTPDTGVLDGYAYTFGIISDRRENELELRDKDGNLLTVDIADGAIIYAVDTEEKFNASNTVISVLRKTGGSKEAFDEDGNFLGWNEKSKYNYAFLRTIDKNATEVVLYKNY